MAVLERVIDLAGDNVAPNEAEDDDAEDDDGAAVHHPLKDTSVGGHQPGRCALTTSTVKLASKPRPQPMITPAPIASHL